MNKEIRKALDDWTVQATKVLSKVASGQGATKEDCDILAKLQATLGTLLE